MELTVREYRPADMQAVVDLSLRAWAPVFASMRAAVGDEIDGLLHGDDWRRYQAAEVEKTLTNDEMRIWVAERAGVVVAFVAVVLHVDDSMGQVWMLAVDPESQDRGIGTRLTEFATDWMRSAGMRLAMIGTGGDPGHAPARRTYEKAGYTGLPAVNYFKVL
jgi:ribosomal protein S18 acetylase RimI-like enzyme